MRLRRGDCAPPPCPQTPKMVGSCDSLHHSRYAGEMTQGVAFQSSAPPAQSRNAPAIRCHVPCCIPPAFDLLRVLSLMGIRGGFAVRRDAGSLIRREARGVGSGKGVALRCRYAVAKLVSNEPSSFAAPEPGACIAVRKGAAPQQMARTHISRWFRGRWTKRRCRRSRSISGSVTQTRTRLNLRLPHPILL